VVFNMLHDAPAVRALVDHRIYRSVAPQGAQAPFIVYSLVYASSTPMISGASDLDARLVQIDIYAATEPQVVSLRNAVRAAMDAGYTVFRGEPLAEREDATQLFRRVLEFNVWVNR
jgi:hypothetical protein